MGVNEGGIAGDSGRGGGVTLLEIVPGVSALFDGVVLDGWKIERFYLGHEEIVDALSNAIGSVNVGAQGLGCCLRSGVDQACARGDLEPPDHADRDEGRVLRGHAEREWKVCCLCPLGASRGRPGSICSGEPGSFARASDDQRSAHRDIQQGR